MEILKNGFVIYSINGCPNCERAKHMLDEAGISYEYVNIEGDGERDHEFYKRVEALEKLSGTRCFPQIYKNGKYFGRVKDLFKFISLSTSSFDV